MVESRRDRRERSARRSSPGHRRGRGPRRGRSHPRRRRRGVHRGGWGPRHQTPDVSLARSRCLRSLRRRGRRPRARGLGPGIRFWYRFGFGPEPRVPRRGDEERRARRSVSPTDGSGGRRPRDVVQARRRRRLPRFRRRRRKRRRERGSVPPKCIFRGFGFGFGFGSSRRARRSDSPASAAPRGRETSPDVRGDVAVASPRVGGGGDALFARDGGSSRASGERARHALAHHPRVAHVCAPREPRPSRRARDGSSGARGRVRRARRRRFLPRRVGVPPPTLRRARRGRDAMVHPTR